MERAVDDGFGRCALAGLARGARQRQAWVQAPEDGWFWFNRSLLDRGLVSKQSEKLGKRLGTTTYVDCRAGR